MSSITNPKPVEPYSMLAKIYDYVMAHVDYKMWAKYIHTFFRFSERPVKDLADLSCGTGNLLSYLIHRKRNLVGLDLSLPMLKEAKQKLLQNGLNRLICSDFKALPLKSDSFDVALSIYDSVNYLIEEQEVLTFLAECYRIVRPGGLLIFDVVTPYVCQTAFKHYKEEATINQNLRYHRLSFYDKKQQMQINQFHIWFNDQYFFEEHKQKIRKITDWVNLIAQSNFKIIEIFSNFSLKPVQHNSERAHFILKRN